MTFWVAGAAIVGGVGGALINSNAAGNAADAQAGSVAASNALQKEEFDQTRADQQPYRDAGYSALDRLSELLGLAPKTQSTFDSAAYLKANPDAQQWLDLKKSLGQPATAYDHYMLANAAGDKRQGYFTNDGAKSADFGSLNQRFTGADLQNEPGYQFGLNEGTKNLEGSAAARGGLYSGATLKALTKYGQDYAGTKYDAAYTRFNHDQDTTFNRLSSISGTGQTATQQVDAAGQAYGQSAGGNLIGAGNSRGSSYIAQGNAFAGGINQAGAAIGNYFSQPKTYAGFNGNQYTGYTNIDPWAVGPQP